MCVCGGGGDSVSDRFQLKLDTRLAMPAYLPLTQT